MSFGTSGRPGTALATGGGSLGGGGTVGGGGGVSGTSGGGVGGGSIAGDIAGDKMGQGTTGGGGSSNVGPGEWRGTAGASPETSQLDQPPAGSPEDRDDDRGASADAPPPHPD